MTLIVVKVGGSLYDLPDLRNRLLRYLATLDAARIVLVPGGGVTADAIRTLDRAHRLGEEASHWLAIGALSLNARFLGRLLDWPLFPAADASRCVLDALPFFQTDEAREHHLPHTWDVTSDSLAVRAAVVLEARELILLKSVGWNGTDWNAAASAGIMDRYFPTAMSRVPALKVRVINLRESA